MNRTATRVEEQVVNVTTACRLCGGRKTQGAQCWYCGIPIPIIERFETGPLWR